MAGRLQGKTAIVTGGASGLGLATALRLGQEGASVVCVDLDAQACTRAAAEVAAGGAQAVGFAGDVTDETSMAAMAASTLERFGRIDILFANAGINAGEARAHEMPLADWLRVLDVNLTGVFLSVKHVLPAMIEAQSGAIVLTSSVAGLEGVPWLPAYAATKGGVVALGRQLATEYAGDQIRVNVIAPGTIKTPLVIETFARRAKSGTDAPATLEDRARDVPMGHLGEVSDVANLVLFLVSDEAGWITGCVHPVDGGLTAALAPRHRPPQAAKLA